MTTYGVTDEGFIIKRLETIKQEMEDSLKAAFGPNINLSSPSVFGQFVGIDAYDFAVIWELAQAIHAGFDPDKATGTDLDALCDLTNITRIPALATTVQASVIGDASFEIPAGSQASNPETGDIYLLDENLTISPYNALQAWVSVNTVTDSTTYTITIGVTPYSINSGEAATEQSILAALMTEVNEDIQATAEFDSGALKITTKNEPFEITTSSLLTIGAVGSPGQFTAQNTGALTLPTHMLSEITTPCQGWSAIDNLSAGITGRARETDEELRVRRRTNIFIMSQHTVDSLYSRLSPLNGVEDVNILQNTGTEEDEFGIPPQHLWIIVYGGGDDAIGQAIYSSIPGGIGMKGAETATVVSQVTGKEYVMKFDRPDVVDAYIELEIEINSNVFPTDGIARIKAALAAWGKQTLKISDPLVYNRLFCPAYSVPGHEIVTLYIGTAPDPTGTASISIDVDEIIEIDADRIEVSIV